MEILYLCGRELNYPRNSVLYRAMQKIGNVNVSHVELPNKSILLQSIISGLSATYHLVSKKYQLTFVGFYGHLLMLPVGLLNKQPILFDAFISTYDTLITDRKSAGPNSLKARSACWLDKTSCSLADQILLDTQQHVDYFVESFDLPREKFNAVPVGCNEDIFRPSAYIPIKGTSIVLYYCTYLPLHGADVVVRAAQLLRSEDIRFRLIGTGPEYRRVHSIATEYGLKNIEFLPSQSLTGLAEEIGRADICLGGHFGPSAKASRVIPGKIYQMLSVGRAVIAAQTPANNELMVDRVNAYFCATGNPGYLAEAIRDLHHNPDLRQELSKNGNGLYKNRASEKYIQTEIARIVSKMIMV
jgi:glycosyltransferase involved in cell wall biosynthesis